MFVDCKQCPLRQSSSFRPLGGVELDFVRTIKTNQLEVSASEKIIHAGDSDDRPFTLFSGWAIFL